MASLLRLKEAIQATSNSLKPMASPGVTTPASTRASTTPWTWVRDTMRPGVRESDKTVPRIPTREILMVRYL